MNWDLVDELNKLDTYDWCFYASLFLAFVSLVGSAVLSYFSAKYWKLDRSRAVLKDVGKMVGLGSNSAGDIDLTDNFYQVEFGIKAQPVDAITLRAVIEGKDWKDGMISSVHAQIFLRDGSFVINAAEGKVSKDAEGKAGSRFFDLFRFWAEGKVSKDAEGKVSKGAVSVYSYVKRETNNIFGETLCYDENDKEKSRENITGDYVLKDKDLIYIKDKDDKEIAAFVFLKDAVQNIKVNVKSKKI